MLHYYHMGTPEIMTTILFVFAIGAGLGYALARIFWGG